LHRSPRYARVRNDYADLRNALCELIDRVASAF
jgi:hypothetical protein